MRRRWNLVPVLAAVMVTMGCSGEAREPSSRYLVTEETARQVLSETVSKAAESESAGFCEEHAVGVDIQRYVSEFFVIIDEGRPKAQVAVYWSGLGLHESPLGPDNTVVPRSACPPA